MCVCVAAGSWRGCVVGSVGNVSCGFSFLFWVLGGLSYSWIDSSLRCVVCVCVLVVVDWFCLSFFF